MTIEDFLIGIFESSIDCIEVLNLDARLLLMNRGGLRAMGMSDLCSLAGRSWVLYWAEQDREATQAAVQSAKAGEIGRLQG